MIDNTVPDMKIMRLAKKLTTVSRKHGKNSIDKCEFLTPAFKNKAVTSAHGVVSPKSMPIQENVGDVSRPILS